MNKPLRRTPMRRKSARTTKARTAACGEECQLRLDCCNHNPETTVLSHVRMFGWAGTAQKPPDFLAIFACSDCHDALDRRSGGTEWGFDDVLRAMGNTLIRQFEKGTFK